MIPGPLIPAYPWDGAIVRFHEIALRRGNRREFLRALKRNLGRALPSVQVRSYFDHLFLTSESEPLENYLFSAARVFGVAYVAPVKRVWTDLEVLKREAVEVFRAASRLSPSTEPKKFAIRVRKREGTLVGSTQALEAALGQAVVDAERAPVSLNAPDIPIHFSLFPKESYLLGPRVAGPGGLPVGTTGKALALFSGGLDSPVAAWYGMRRGLKLDFIHFYSLRSAEEVEKTHLIALLQKILEPQGLQGTCHLIPTDFFQTVVVGRVDPAFELILFRRFMFRVAGEVAQKLHCQALLTGDNLGQVASQTLENLAAADAVTSLPLFRPLLSFNKPEILEKARELGTYDLSILPYKDCCSLLARHPKTRPKLSAVEREEGKLPVPELVERALKDRVQLP